MKKSWIFKNVILVSLTLLFFVSSPLYVMAANLSVTPELTNIKQVDTLNKVLIVNAPTSNLFSNQTPDSTTSAVAMITIFADSSSGEPGSSGGDGSLAWGNHAFITVKNMSASSINIGKFSGIAPSKTLSIGTWGNEYEHNGLWYNLESYFIYYRNYYANRVSASYLVTATELNTLNSYITNNDQWSWQTNCSSFAAGAWNSAVDPSYSLSAGIPNTPKNLSSNLKAKFPGAPIGGLVPYDYLVYFANGTGNPIRSSVY